MELKRVPWWVALVIVVGVLGIGMIWRGSQQTQQEVQTPSATGRADDAKRLPGGDTRTIPPPRPR